MSPKLGETVQRESRASKHRDSKAQKHRNKPTAAAAANAIRSSSELIVGKDVRHRSFGTGTIFKADEEQVFVRFQNEVKVLSIAVCLGMGLLESVAGDSRS